MLRILEWTLAAYDRLGVVRDARGQPARQLGAARQLPDRRRQVRVHRRRVSDANFARLCKAMDRPDLLDDPRFAQLADRAAHSDEINGIVAEWTRSLDRDRGRSARASRTTCPVATAYTAADIFADPHIDGARRPRDGRRSGHRPGAPAGAVPALRRRAAGRADRRAAARRAHPRGAARRCSALDDAELDRLARAGRSCDGDHDGLFELDGDGSIALVGGYSPTSGTYHFPLLDACPYTGATTSSRSTLSDDGDVVGLDRGHRRAARLHGTGAVRVRRRRARRRAACAWSRRLTESDPAQLDVRPTDALVADELPDGRHDVGVRALGIEAP